MATMVICQIMLVLWKKHYFESYQSVTLLGMWLIPLYFSVELLFYRMLFFWGLFTVCTVRTSLSLTACGISSSCCNPDSAMQGLSRVAPRCQMLTDAAIGPNILVSSTRRDTSRCWHRPSHWQSTRRGEFTPTSR